MNLKEVPSVFFDTLLFIGMAIVYITESLIMTMIPRRYREKSIRNEIALVTGGAAGIGRLIAKKLAARGARVIIWDVNKSGIESVVQEIKANGGRAWGYYCDITDKEGIYRTAKAVKIEVGNVTLLVNNAGYVYGETLWKLPDYEIEHTYKVNVLSHYWTTKAFLEEMMKENHGHIVTIASVAGLLGTYKCTDYSATKFAAIGYHESLFTELKTHGYDGIHMTLVCPYFINTGMFPGVKPRLKEMLEPEYVSEEVIWGILMNEVNVTLPSSVKFLLPLKCLLPAKMCWSLMYHIIQGPQSMMMLQKSREGIQKRNNNVERENTISTH